MVKLTKRISKTTKQYIVVCILAVFVAGGSAAGIAYKIIDGIKTDYDTQLDECFTEMNNNKRNVYITTKDVVAGEVLTKDSIEMKNVYATQPQDTYMNESDIGKVVLIDIKSQTQVQKSMITDTLVDSAIRETEYSTILVSANMLENDVVDVRIAYPNGEDYVILPKKILKGYTGETMNCYFWLDEEEIIRMRNAAVDAYLYTGSYLYTTKYIEPNLQEASIVTYTPSVEAINLIQENPNILETATNELSTLVRKALENRLAKSMNKDIATEQWSIFDDNIYQQYDGQKLDNDKQGPKSETEKEEGSTNITTDTPQEREDESEDDQTVDPEVTDYPEIGKANNGTNNIIQSGPDLGDTRSFDEKQDDVSDYFNITEG